MGYYQQKKLFYLMTQPPTNPTHSKPKGCRDCYDPYRMELFEPCSNYLNQSYTYKVHQLAAREVQLQNALVLNEEADEFVFHDYDKIRDSFWAYENIFTMVNKKHDYSI